MFYKTKTIDRNLQSVPFERAFQLYTDAYNNSIQNQEHYYTQERERRVQYVEQQYAETNEAPLEVSVDIKVKEASVAKAQEAGQKAILEEFLVGGLIADNMQQHFMPQILKLLASRWNPNECYYTNEAGAKLVDGVIARSFLFKEFTSDWDKGLWLFLMLDSRSSWLKSQYKGEARAYCSLVPLILYAIKTFHNVRYGSWGKNLEAVVNKKLADAMLFEFHDDGAWDFLSNEEKIQCRNQGLTFKTGPKVGQMRNPETTYKLFNTTNTPLQGVPELAQVIETQIWCAHPANRTRHMILDRNNWDGMPEPLIEQKVFLGSTKETKHDLPWM